MNNRTVIIAGATGLVGQALLHGLLADPGVSVVHSLGRRPLPIRHPKLVSHLVDFSNLPALPPSDEVYLALGTTIKAAGSQAGFRAIDFDANLAVARAALAAGARRLGLVSAMGADAHSRVFYNRVKGELEDALTALPFEGIAIARPSLLVGDRGALGQKPRMGEAMGLALARALGFLVPDGLKPIHAAQVARALLAVLPTATSCTVLDSASIQRADLG